MVPDETAKSARYMRARQLYVGRKNEEECSPFMKSLLGCSNAATGSMILACLSKMVICSEGRGWSRPE